MDWVFLVSLDVAKEIKIRICSFVAFLFMTCSNCLLPSGSAFDMPGLGISNILAVLGQ